MEKLTKILNERIAKSKYKEKLEKEFEKNKSGVYPFNKFEYIMGHLLSEGIMSIEEYCDIRAGYTTRNKNLPLYEITAPRTFGESWAQKHLNKLVPELKKPGKKYDPEYSRGKYDFWYNGIRIEVKASRAVQREEGAETPLVQKALSSDTKQGFDMNFQQMKPGCCDVFIWIGVWADTIYYWVLSSKEVKEHERYSNGQHRGNTGEGQLWVKETNIKQFEKYLKKPDEILEAIIEKAANNSEN